MSGGFGVWVGVFLVLLLCVPMFCKYIICIPLVYVQIYPFVAFFFSFFLLKGVSLFPPSLSALTCNAL